MHLKYKNSAGTDGIVIGELLL